ncbi:MAG: hypothetical protein NZ898_02525 [Myxococcota bacterium]|nr:hypothetical protein [Myxococcota bacterium]MDW8362634.1 hypothetical protein [Myxococcales bacterium]
MLRLGCSALLLAALPEAAQARAYAERWSAGALAGHAAVLVQSALPVHGLVASARAAVPLDDVWEIRATAGYAWHPSGRPLHVGIGALDAVYRLDVATLVPVFGLGLSGLLTAYDSRVGLDAGLTGCVGLDWFVAPDLVVLLEVRPHVLLLGLPAGLVEPVYVNTLVGVLWLFEP